jgi:hypothetical protein
MLKNSLVEFGTKYKRWKIISNSKALKFRRWGTKNFFGRFLKKQKRVQMQFENLKKVF